MNNKLIARAVLLEQFEDGMDIQKAIARVISELGPEVINEEEAAEWYAKFTAGDTDISVEFLPDDQLLLRNGTFLKWTRATTIEFGYLKCFSKANKIDTPSPFITVNPTVRYSLADTLYQINRHTRFNWSKFAHITLACSNYDYSIRHICNMRLLRFLNDNYVFGIMSIITNRNDSAIVLFCGTFDFPTRTLTIKNLLSFDWAPYCYTIEGKTENQIIIVLLQRQSRQTQISTVNVENGKLAIESTIEGPTAFINATLRGDKLFGFQGADTKNLVEFSLTDQTTRIHKIEKGEQAENVAWATNEYVWIGNELLLGRSDKSRSTATIYVFDLVGLEWRKTKYEVGGRILEMATNDGNQLNVYVQKNNADESFYQFQYNKTDSLAKLTWKAMFRYSQGHQQFFQWFQSKLPKGSKFRFI